MDSVDLRTASLPWHSEYDDIGSGGAEMTRLSQFQDGGVHLSRALFVATGGMIHWADINHG